MPIIQFPVTEEDLQILEHYAKQVEVPLEEFVQTAMKQLIESLREMLNLPNVVNDNNKLKEFQNN